MRRAWMASLLALSVLLFLAWPASAWQLRARISRPYCGLVVFHVENHGDRIRYVTLKTGTWKRYVEVPPWGGIHVDRASKARASVWRHGEPIVSLEGCGEIARGGRDGYGELR